MEELHIRHELLDRPIEDHIQARRKEFRQIFAHDTIGIIGPCSMSEEISRLNEEGDQIIKVSELLGGDGMIIHRIPPWKPRTNPDDWHGLETTDLDLAIETVSKRSWKGGNVAIEIGKDEHINRYSRFLTFAWVGSRNFDNRDLQKKLILSDPSLNVGIKNGKDCNVDDLLERIAFLRHLRRSWLPSDMETEGHIIPIFRGGPSITTPSQWEDKFFEFYDTFAQDFITDTAHGGEVAHHPNGFNRKSKMGQLACLSHYQELQWKYQTHGVMIEASDIDSLTDPVIPLVVALDAMRSIVGR